MCGPKRFLVAPPRETSTGGGERASSIAGACRRYRWRRHCEMWKQTQSADVSRWTMSRALKRLGWTRSKKSLGAKERNEEERAAWRENASQLSTDHLVFIDECGSNMARTPLYARARHLGTSQGKCSAQPGAANTTLIAALSLEGMGAALIPGSDRPIPPLLSCISSRSWLPASMQGRLSSWTRLLAHKSAGQAGERPRKAVSSSSRPRYSPDLSATLEAFSKLKTARLRAGARTREALQEAIGQALLTITAQDARGWFQHCGYLLPGQEKKS